MQNVPQSERIFIAFFGGVNAGKSSVVNRMLGQSMSIVSEQAGTTTDPVIKSMELAPLGPVTVCDTAGFDDSTALGSARVEKTMQVLRKTDVAVLVMDAQKGKTDTDELLIKELKTRSIPYILCWNKTDLLQDFQSEQENELLVSAKTGEGIEQLKDRIAGILPQKERKIIADLFEKDDLVLLVTPIDQAAPKGRLILPQQLVLRELLDIHAAVIVVQETELDSMLKKLAAPPKAVITDSQVFEYVKTVVPEDVYLTSFSILMQRYKGVLKTALAGADSLDTLSDGDTVLVCEGCTHHKQCNDIGSVKLPKWIKDYTGKNLRFEYTAGGEYPVELEPFSLVLHCGGCMLNEKEMEHRKSMAVNQGVPFTNYGLVIAKMNGILDRSMKLIRDKGAFL